MQSGHAMTGPCKICGSAPGNPRRAPDDAVCVCEHDEIMKLALRLRHQAEQQAQDNFALFGADIVVVMQETLPGHFILTPFQADKNGF
jgi:hypothetical protein